MQQRGMSEEECGGRTAGERWCGLCCAGAGPRGPATCPLDTAGTAGTAGRCTMHAFAAPCMHSPHHARIRYDSPPSTSTHQPSLPRSRRLCVDLPHGLVCFKGVAEILKVPTPTMDK